MLGIFGGSFDPVHLGHIKSAVALLENFAFEQIRFVPCQLSPLKERVFANAQHRMQMLNLVCGNQSKLMVDDRELRRTEPSYTIDTLTELREELGANQSIVLILGVDAYLEFCKWHQYDEILSFCHILIMQRPGYSLFERESGGTSKTSPKTSLGPESGPESDAEPDTELGSGCEKEYFDINKTEDSKLLTKTPCGKIYISELEKYDISSTLIRKVIAQGQQPKYMLPGNVWNYVKRNKLYQP